MFRQSNLRNRLISWFLLVALVPLLVATYFIYRASSTELVKRQETSALDYAQSVSKGMNQWLETRQSEIELAAKSEPIRSLNVPSQMNHLKMMKEQLGVYEIIMFVSANGIATASSAENLGTNYIDRDYFQKAMSGQTNLSSIIISRTTGNRIIAVASPVKNDKGEIIGVVAGTVNFEELIKQSLTNLSLVGSGGYPILVDDKQQVQIYPTKEAIGKTLDKSGLSPDLANILKKASKESGIGSYTDKGKQYLVVYTPIQKTGYGLALHIPMDSMVSTTSAITVSVSLILVIAAALVVLISFLIARSISNPIRMVADQMKLVADGNLAVEKIDLKNRDEVGRLAEDFNTMIDNLKAIIKQISSHSKQLASTSDGLRTFTSETKEASQQMAVVIDTVAEGSKTQMESTGQTVKAMEEMAIGIQRIAETSSGVSESAWSMAKGAEHGNESIQKAIRQIDSLSNSVNHSASVVKLLGERSKEIGQIVEVITGIAAQTNLLALNAAIEAARAGEQGRGFAVVADEVRKLAEQSEASANQITELIKEIQADTARSVQAMDVGISEVEAGMAAVNEAGEALNGILQAAQQVADQIQEISAASEEMSAGTEEVTASVGDVAQIAVDSANSLQVVSTSSQKQLHSIEEVSTSAQTLSQLADDLQKILAKFKL
ncbi:methyl-accepting chemotaxis protein [Effusibacillus dendaii]|uniref:Methyl-accepting chemotaxis sensory transducer n=1 Tax=Effusibacillus dendaii TaxID=2743772 RepID=A0A7I8DDH6_9BACL|nr:methyl-accepting chemotaxis protein [Effusibacillus dendaii]BCJ88145.1 methyl-accepting chemotaxis sensory transducer [Effusibacillus dendaii]